MQVNTQVRRQFKLSGLSVALGAAALYSACASNPATIGAALAADKADLVHCSGVNACKGHNDCKTASNACAGHGECKGQGFVAMPAKACTDIGGKVKDSFKGEVAKADLSHCYNVNACKGHNDCKTASNACAGQGACKGQGYVAMPAKACENVGGKVGA